MDSAGSGAFVEVGRVPGRLVAVDPTGRYLALARPRTLTVHDAEAGLAPTLAGTPSGPYQRVVVHPSGQAVALLTDAGRVEVWWAGRETCVVGAEPDGREPGRPGPPDRYRPKWLQFTADGAYLLVGEASRRLPARLGLFDAVTLAPLDVVTPLHTGDLPDEPLADWGEGVYAVCAPPPSAAVALASNFGDNIAVLAVAVAAGGRLRVRGAGQGDRAWAHDLPGERVLGVALSAAADALVVLDSDQFVSVLPWADAPATVEPLRGIFSRSPAGEDLVARLGGLVAEGEELELNGPLAVRGHLLAVPVERERLTEGRYAWQTVALAVLDLDSRRWRGHLELPGAERAEPVEFDAGLVCQYVRGRTRVARWLPPEGGAGVPGKGGVDVSAIEIRAGRTSDAAALLGVFHRSRTAAMPWLPVLHTAAEDGHWMQRIVLARHAVLVAEEHGAAGRGRPLGFAAVQGDLLGHLYVEPERRGQGIGTRLLDAVREGRDRVELWVFQRNTAARRFYERHGFTPVEFGDGSTNEEGLPDARYAWTRATADD